MSGVAVSIRATALGPFLHPSRSGMIGQPALPTQDLPHPATRPRDGHDVLLDALLEALRTDAPPLWSNIEAERALCHPVLWRSVKNSQ
jgi:hypothetical protein